jgi:hypothetical protein
MRIDATQATARAQAGVPEHLRAVGLAAAGILVIAAFAAVAVGNDRAFAPALLAAAAVFGSVSSWRTCLLAAPLLLLVEALLRRFVVNDVWIFFAKDVLLAFAYAKYARARLREHGRPIPRAAVNLPIALLALLVVGEAFNPTLPSPVIGVLGIYIWLWYAPVCWLVRDAFPTARAAVRAAALYLALFVPLGVLAQIQQHVSAANRSYYDTEVGSTEFVYDGQIIHSRSVGTFASTNAFGDYLVFVAVLVFSLVLAARGRRSMVALLAVMAAFVLAVGGTGNRSASGAAFISLLAALALHRRRDRTTARALALGGAFLLSLIVLPPLLPGLDRAGVTGFAPASLSSRLSAHLYDPVEKIFDIQHGQQTAGPRPSVTTTTAGGTGSTGSPPSGEAPAPAESRGNSSDLTAARDGTLPVRRRGAPDDRAQRARRWLGQRAVGARSRRIRSGGLAVRGDRASGLPHGPQNGRL